MARWRFAGGTGTGGALKFPLTLPAGDYVYKLEDSEVVISSAEPIVIDVTHPNSPLKVKNNQQEEAREF